MRASYRTSFGLAAILLAIIAVYWPALHGGFIFDDYPIFVDNPVIHVAGWHAGEWMRILAWSHANIQRPLAMLSYAANYAAGSGSWGFKATNLLIHLGNTCLVYVLASRLLTTCWQPAEALADDHAHRRRLAVWALGIAATWGLHPLQVSTVMYVVQRMEMLAFGFVLLALLAYWRGRRQQIAGRRAWPWLLLAALLIPLGYQAKETAVLTPGYALLLELTVLRFAAARPAVRRAWQLCYAIGCVMVVLAFLYYVLPHYATAAAYAGRDYNAWQRELTQLRALSMYLGWIVLPLPSHLHFYYDGYVASTGWLHPASTLFGGLFLLALLILAVAMHRRRPLAALGIGWFFVAHALTSSPIALELVFEHRNYPALLGPILTVADLLWWLTQKLRSIVPGIVGVLTLFAFAFLTLLRALTWSSPLMLASTLVQLAPESSRAALDLARRYVAMSGNNPDNPLYSLGIQQLQRATRLPGDSILPEQALIMQIASHPGADPQVWWNALDQKLRERPFIPDTYRALLDMQQDRLNGATGIDARQLAGAYRIAIAREPARVSLRAQYAELASLALDDPTQAIIQWREVVALQNHDPGYAGQLADYLIAHGRDQEALAVIAEAERLDAQRVHDPAWQARRERAIKALSAPAASGNTATPR